MKNVKQHASDAAEAVARGASTREAYSAIVGKLDLTLGECMALRTEIENAVVERLRELQRLVDAAASTPL